MNHIKNLANKLKNKDKLKLLFITPNYQNLYMYYIVNTSWFDKNLYDCHVIYILNDDIDFAIELFKSKNFDCVINLCDGYIGNKHNIPNTNLIEKLESNKIPYTGSSSRVYILSKSDLSISKHSPKIITNIQENLNYPLFIKPDNLGCSELVDDESIVFNKTELETQLLKFNDVKYVIQEYIDDIETTVLIFRNKSNEIVCLDPIQIVLPNGTKYLTHKTKLEDFDNVTYNFDVKNKQDIKNVCIDIYNELSLNSYVRIDLRGLKVIDINSYPEIFGSIEEETLADSIIKTFYNFDDFLLDIIYDGVNRSSIKPQ